jgi:hypothetical protein
MGFCNIIKLQRKASISASILASILLNSWHGKFHKSSINRGYFEQKEQKRRADKNPLFGAIKPYVTWVWLSLEVSVKESLKRLAAWSFVAVALCKTGVKRIGV